MSAVKSSFSDTLGGGRSSGPETCLTLMQGEIRFRSNGMEFDSRHAYPHLAELTLRLLPPHGGDPMECRGVVVACHGTPAMGYSISIYFLNLQPGGESALRRLFLS